MIKVAFATGTNGEFGNGDGLPWGNPLKGDMDAFKEFTKDCILLMGHNTFESLPCKLPNRLNIVLSSGEPVAKNGDKPYTTFDLDDSGYNLRGYCNVLTSRYSKPVCIIGGAALVREGCSFANKILRTSITKIDEFGRHVEMPCTVGIGLLPAYLGAIKKFDFKAEGDYHYTIMEYEKDVT